MKAAYIEATGAAESTIKFGDVPTAEADWLPGPRQSRRGRASIRSTPISATVRNYWELPKPFIIGCDLAGTIEAVGPRGEAIQSRRPRLGLEPGADGPPRNVRRILRRR